MLGLRAIAALSILLYHVWLYATPGGPLVLSEPFQSVASYSRAGTSIFILLSSFLLYLPFARAILMGQPLPSPARFLRRRVLRLVPAYWLVLFVVSLVLGAALVRTNGQPTLGSFADRPDLLVVNLLLLQNFWPDTFLTGIGPAWFVTTTFVFYLSLPLIAYLGARLARRSDSTRARTVAALAPAAGLLVLGLTTKAVVQLLVVPPGWTPGWDADWSSVVVRSFVGQADRFSYGMAAAVVFLNVQLRRERLPARWWTLSIAGTLVVGGLAIFLHRQGSINDLGLESGLAISLSFVVLTVALQGHLSEPERRLMGPLDSGLLTALGLTSYSIFLWHEPIIRWMTAHGLTFSGPIGIVANFVLVGGVVMALSVVSYGLVERPALSTRRPIATDGTARPPPW
jgi:peptidoglycan/LPS O-acetylase OafA/YrhL